MSSNDLMFGISVAGGGLLLIGIILFTMATLFHLGKLWRTQFVKWIVPMLALGVVTSVLFSSRDLSPLILTFVPNIDRPNFISINALRLLTIAVVGLSLALIVGIRFFDKQPGNQPGFSLFGAFITYFVTNNILNGAFGAHPTFDSALIYPVAIIGATFYTRDIKVDVLVRAAKLGIMFMLVLSLILALVSPKLAVQTAYQGWVPGLNGRLWGVGSNPNSIGPLALIYLVLEFGYSRGNGLNRWLGVAIAILVLIYTQSKTTWLGAMVLVTIMLWYHAKANSEHPQQTFIFLSAAAAILGIVALFVVDPMEEWGRITGSAMGSDITTMTGRSAIWSIALKVWEENPLFGYGLSAWGDDFRRGIGMPHAFSAHNQFMQSLSVAGLVGLAGLLLYLIVIGMYARQRAVRSNGATIALFVFTLIRSITETPLDITGIFSGEFIAHLLIIQLLLCNDLNSSTTDEQGSAPVKSPFLARRRPPLH